MSAVAGRWSLLRQLLAACGALAPTAVAAGGLALGFAVWQATCAGARGATSVAAFAVLAIVCIAAAAVAWLWPCARAAAGGGGGSLVAILRYDAVPYAALLVYPIVELVRPGPAGREAAAALAVLGFVAGTIVAIARFHVGFRTTLFVFGMSRLVVFAIAELAAVFVGDRGVTHPASLAGTWLDVWGRWDGAHYLAIARDGYHGSNLAFFPLYPLAIRLLGAAIGNPLLAAIAISNVSLLVALAYLRRLCAELFDDGVASRTIFYLATFPTAVFLSAAYTESLFLALSVATFFYLRRRNWLLAGFLGGLAALTRIEGVLLLVPYAFEALENARAVRGIRRIPYAAVRGAPLAGAAMIAFGLVTFMLLSTLLSGDPLSFAHVQSHWHRHAAWPWQSIGRSVHAIATTRDLPTLAVQSIDLAFAFVVAALVVGGVRMLPHSFTAYAACSLLVPLLTGSLMSIERFALALFPIFIVLGVNGRRPFLDLGIRALSLPFLGAFTLLFAAAYWIG